MKRYGLYAVGFLLLLATLFPPAGLSAAPYFEGKRINFIVGFAPGGGYDRMARLFARYLPDHIPGRPTIIVQNIPGASSMIAANQLYSGVKADGLTIGTINRGLPIAQLLQVQGVQFDLRKFSWLGSASVDTNVLCIRSDLPYKTFQDVKNTKNTIFLATGGPMTSSGQFGVLLKEYLNLNVQIVTYTNMANALLAVERKEADGVPSTYSSLRPLIERGVIRPVLRSRISQPGIENLPVDEEMTQDKMGKVILGMRSVTDQFGRPFVAPPGVPGDIMKILRDGFVKATKDKKLLAESEKAMMPIDYVSGEEVMEGINYLLNQPDDIVKEFSKYVQF